MTTTRSIPLKIVSIIAFLSISGALALISQSQMAGYELFMYSAISPLIWALLIIATTSGIGIMIHTVMEGEEGDGWWKLGLLMILLSNLTIMLLPFLRGYATNVMGDHLAHIGYMKAMLHTGVYHSVYPTIHILASQLSLILNTSVDYIAHFINPLIYFLSVMGCILLFREILPTRVAILAILSGTITFYFLGIDPNTAGFMIFPLMFYVYFKVSKEQSVSARVLLIILIIFMVFIHPAASFMLMAALIVMEIAKPFVKWLCDRQMGYLHSYKPYVQKTFLGFIAISFIALLLWIWTNFAVWHSAVNNVVDWFHYQIMTVPLSAEALRAFSALDLGTYDIVKLFIMKYGVLFIYLILSMITSITLLRGKTFSRFIIEDTRSVFLLLCFFWVIVVLNLIDFVKPFSYLGSGRLTTLVAVLAPILVGLALYQICCAQPRNEKGHDRRLPPEHHRSPLFRAGVTWALVTVCSLIGIFSLYPSSLTLEANTALSYSEISGAKWQLQNGNPDLKVIPDRSIDETKLVSALWGADYLRSRKYSEFEIKGHFSWDIGARFDYSKYSTLAESAEGEAYLMLSEERLLSIYRHLYPQIGSFSEDDCCKLASDCALDKLYDNGVMQEWYVYQKTSAG